MNQVKRMAAAAAVAATSLMAVYTPAHASIYGDRVAADSPVHYWNFDEAATGTGAATDSGTPGGNTGTFVGTATRTDGLVGLGAADFNNTAGDGVLVGNANYSFTTGITVEAVIAPQWNGASFNYDEIFRKEDGGNRILLSFQNDPNNGGANPPVAAGPVLSFGLNVGGVYSELDMPLDGAGVRPTLADLTDGNPHYIAATYNAATGEKAIWVDGAVRWSTTLAGNITSGGGTIAQIGNTAGGGEPFTNTIDEVALYSSAHTISEVAERHLALTTSLIGPLDIADTFTREIYGGLDNRNLGTATPLVDYRPEVRPAGSTATWVGVFSIADDSNIAPGSPAYPGTNGRGSDTGITQTGTGGEYHYAIQYGLRNDFVVQFDTLLASDRVDIYINDAPVNGFIGGITDNVGLAVFFRDDLDVNPSIGVYNGVAEIDTGLTTGLSPGEEFQWHNFAVRFDLDSGLLWFFVDEVLRGSFDYTAAFPLLNPSNAFIGIGSASGGTNRLWVDNFQVGAMVPAPAALPAGLALLTLTVVRRRRRSAR